MDAQRCVIHPGSAPLTEQFDQALATGFEHIAAMQCGTWAIRVLVQVDPLVGHMGAKALVRDVVAPGADLICQLSRADDGLC
ncbi:hypothetical protein D3C76_1739480 [compost metagenome]